ncbi:MAG: 4Fe-4S ferredoxin iron-sulfur binding domain protein [Firmicutes bacterium]|nr:4Fe-4S ferredoxin iron-sulfur binding domain protein [Bacillota bacterium]
MPKRVNAMYFSATGTTEKVVTEIASEIAGTASGCGEVRLIDFTHPDRRKEAVSFSGEDIVIFGVPVIAGRVPNVLLKYLRSINAGGAVAAAVVVYGNRNYDDALAELTDILEADGFRVAAGAAFIGEHSFSKVLAKGRPDEKDIAAAADFARSLFRKIASGERIATPAVKGERPYRSYYMPRDREGNPVDIRKVTPKTSSSCTGCGICAEACPMGSIDLGDTSVLKGICIKCCACVKKCPVQAKSFDDEKYLNHKNELEAEFSARREPEMFI